MYQLNLLLMLAAMMVGLLGTSCSPDMKTAEYAYSKDDYNTARLQYEALAARGFPDAQMELGKMYLYGRGVERDPERALELFQKADHLNGEPNAKRYIRRAKAYVGRIAIKGKAKNFSPEQGLAMLQEAAERGNRTALFELGYAYEHGLADLAVNGIKASEYYARSAQAGYSRAIHYQAELYEDGELVPQNLRLAAKLYESAIEGGYPRSAINLGKMYEQGRGVPQSTEKAMKYYKLASSNGVDAQSQIADLQQDLKNDQ